MTSDHLEPPTDASGVGVSGPTVPMETGELLFVGPVERPDEYELTGVGHKGGEGVVLQARYRGSLPRAVPFAIKQLVAPPYAEAGRWPDDQQVARWREQLKLLHLLRHQHLVGYRDLIVGWPPHPPGTCTGDPPVHLRTWYLVMEWIDGPNLHDLVRSGQASLAERFDYIVQLAQAVEYLHSGADTAGLALLHRDIKPGNVIINADRGAVLVDYGLMRVEEPILTELPAWTGPYLAPEVHADKTRTTRASDLWAVAATAFFSLTGVQPSPFDPGRMSRELAEHVPNPAGVSDVLMEVLDRVPEERPTSPTQWAGALAREVTASPDTAPPPGQATGTSRRRPFILAAAALVVVAAAAVSLVLSTGHHHGPPRTPASPAPRLSELIPASEKVIATKWVRLDASGAPVEAVTTVRLARRLGPSQDLYLLAVDSSTNKWKVVFDAAKTSVQLIASDSGTTHTALIPNEDGSVNAINTVSITPTRGTTDLVVSEEVTPGANAFLNVGVVHYAGGGRASLAYGGSFLNGTTATVVGPAPHQRLQLTIGWITDSDPVCCSVRPYQQTIGWLRHGGFGVVSDTRSFLGVTVAATSSDGSSTDALEVLAVAQGSPASGVLLPGDILLGVQGVEPPTGVIGSPVVDEIDRFDPGSHITLLVQRNGNSQSVPITLSSYASSSAEGFAKSAQGWWNLGLEAADLTPAVRAAVGTAPRSGAIVLGVANGSPSDQVGLVPGDVIVSVGSHRITSTATMSTAFNSSGSVVVGYVDYNGQMHTVTFSAPVITFQNSYSVEITEL